MEAECRSCPEASVEAGHLAAEEDWGCMRLQEAVSEAGSRTACQAGWVVLGPAVVMAAEVALVRK